MKLSISNIAWTKEEDEAIYKLMRQYSYRGIEISPSRIWNNPTEIKKEAAFEFKKEIEKQGLNIVAMQSLLFKHPELTIFESEEKNHDSIVFLKKIIDLAHNLGNLSIVYGSPKNRIIGKFNKTRSDEIAFNTFKELGDYSFSKNVNFCLEPNPIGYGTNFLNTTKEVVELVKKVNSPGLWVNIDAGTIALNNEPVEKTLIAAIPYAKHLHLSEPFLKEITNMKLHSLIIKTARFYKYDGYISIEMKNDLNRSNITTIKNVFNLLNPIFNNV